MKSIGCNWNMNSRASELYCTEENTIKKSDKKKAKLVFCNLSSRVYLDSKFVIQKECELCSV